MWNMVMSLSEYRESLTELTGLELWYAAEKGAEHGHDLKTSVNSWTDLYCFSAFFGKEISVRENAEWNAFLEKLPGYDVAAFMVNFEPRMKKDLENARKDISRSFAGFMYEFHHEYFEPPDSGELLTLHFRNYFAPDSPSDHGNELAARLSELVAKARVERPDVRKVQCASWLNNIPFFLRLFPDAWQANAADCPYEPSAGWWGQFIDRSGGISLKNTAYLKERGEFKYKNTHSVCAISDLERHLSVIY
ncbi:MAG: hypothetical protein WCS96_00015 [Victivallales bacterium]